MSKGDGQRDRQITDEQWRRRFDAIDWSIIDGREQGGEAEDVPEVHDPKDSDGGSDEETREVVSGVSKQ